MEWRHVKTILILFLLLANALLGWLYFQRLREDEYIRAEAEGHLTALLAARDVTLAPRLPALSAPPVSIRPLYLQRNEGTEAAWVTALLDSAPAGVSDGQTTVYQNNAGQAVFRMDGQMSIERHRPFSRPGGGVEDLSDFLRRTGLSRENNPALRPGADAQTVLWEQTADGLPVFDGVLTFTYRDGDLYGVSGLMLLGEPLWGEEEPIPSLSLPLLRRFSDGSTAPVHIDGLTLGYLASPLKNNVIRLWPVWRLTMGEKTLYLDAYTGENR